MTDVAVQAVRAEHQPVPAVELEGQRVHQHAGEGAERAGDDVLEARFLRLFRRDQALAELLLHQAVILGELVALAAAHQEDPAVAHVRDERGRDFTGVEAGDEDENN